MARFVTYDMFQKLDVHIIVRIPGSTEVESKN